MTAQNKYRLLLCLSLLFYSFISWSQCSPKANAVSDLTLQCSGGTAQRSAVAFYPTQNVYYSVNEGSTSNPIETFSYTGGSHLSTTLQAGNYAGFWYNVNLGLLEGNDYNQSAIVQQSINPINSFALSTTSIVANASMPSSLSCGQFDPATNEVIYYNALTIYKYSRSTGVLNSTLAITGLPSTFINANSIIYTGIAGYELGVFDYVNRKVYLINYTTGACVFSCQLPLTAPAPASFGVSFANNRLFLFDSSSLCWYGYKLSNKPDLFFSGYNILCHNQDEWVSVWNMDNDLNTYTWTPAPFLLNSNTLGVAISHPTVTTLYSVAVTSTAGCVNASSFLMTVYPNLVNGSTYITGTNSLSCTNLAPVVLTANGSVSYTWTTGSQTNTTVVTPTTTTEYRVVGKDAMGCRSPVIMFTVTVYGGPTVTVNSTHSLVCDQTATLTASGAATYTWSNGLNTSGIVVSPTITTTYSVVGENTVGCKDVRIIQVIAGHIPTLIITSGTNIICEGKWAGLIANGANTYTWSNGTVDFGITVQPTITTSYSVIGTSALGCTNTAVITVSVSDCLGIENNNVDQSPVKIYPNPNTGEFKIHLTSFAENSFLEIINSVGQSIFKAKPGSTEYAIDLRSQPDGMYLLIYTENEKRKVTRKIIKE